MSAAEIRERLVRYGQEHLLQFWDQLTPERRGILRGQIDQIDLDWLQRLVASHVIKQPSLRPKGKIQPLSPEPANPSEESKCKQYVAARKSGMELISRGQVAALVVAGGQGSRLGFDGPKGCLGVTPVRGKSLFQVFAEKILAMSKRAGYSVPWYIMTSPTNDQATRAFFDEHGHFGLSPDDVFIFQQGTLPSVDHHGKVLMATQYSLSLNPDGHGGVFKALKASGALDDMASRGVELISYFQVDNPLVRPLDPLFLGLHHQLGAQMSAKSLPKRHPQERLGNLCLIDGRTAVIEYSEMPEELARITDEEGKLRYNAGSIAIHILNRSFIETILANGSVGLPIHRADRKVSCVATDGRAVKPEETNAIKFETFIFDALPLAQRVLVLETERQEEFSPVKNATGEDTLASCISDQIGQAARWLQSAGVTMPYDREQKVAATVEISPLFADSPQELAQRVHHDKLRIRRGDSLYLE